MRVLVLLMASALVVTGADWLSAHSRLQPEEKELSAESVANLKLLWKLPFGERLTAAVVLGPIFTHRGIKELVFLAGAGDNLYALDADLGRVVWKRHFAETVTGCAGLTAAPVLAPYYGPAPNGGDASTPRRSLFVLTSDGRLHTVRPADGYDLAASVDLVPAGSNASDLALQGSTISTFVSSGCGKTEMGEWSITPGDASAKASVHAAKPEPLGAILANGLAFSPMGSSLAVRSAATGKQLFLSEANGAEPVTQSLAIANGHVYLVAGQTVYCYGFPIEI